MEFVQAQFSLKFEPQIRIRRNVNQIEDFLEQYYGAPKTMPIPDEFAAEAPRIILNSKNGHSQVSFSQISVDFTVNFDSDFKNDFDLTKEYILKRIDILKRLLREIDISNYYFGGITYNVHLDTQGSSNTGYIKKILGNSAEKENNIYEAMQKIAVVVEDKYFINQQISTYKEYQRNGNVIPNLINFLNSKLVEEGVNLSLDINNRYEYLYTGKETNIENLDKLIIKLYELTEQKLKEWS